jgi:antitoxin CptB
MQSESQIHQGRLRWHCRRALLELDLLFQRFWEKRGEMLDQKSAAVLERLLVLEDHDLWDLISGRTQTDDADIVGLIGILREA